MVLSNDFTYIGKRGCELLETQDNRLKVSTREKKT